MTPISPSAVAVLLSPTQRTALLWLPDDGSLRADAGNKHRMAMFYLTNKTIQQNIVATLAEGRWININTTREWRATPLGLRVRKCLVEGE